MKRLLAAVLCAVMVLALLPVTALAAEDYSMDFTETTAQTWAGGKIPATEDASGTGWSWAHGSKTLTLIGGLNFTTTAATAMRLPAGATVELNGSSTVKSNYSGNAENSVGVWAEGTLTVKGTGTLESAGGNGHGSYGSYGFYAGGDTTMQDSAKIYATAGNGVDISQGVLVWGSLTLGRQASMDSCVITGTSGTAKYNDGVVAGDITVYAHAQLTGTGDASTNQAEGMSSGVSTPGSIAVSDNARVTGTAGDAYRQSTGVVANTGITVSGDTLKGTSANAVYDSSNPDGSWSYGVATLSGNITVSGGTLEAKSGTADPSGASLSRSYGVYAPGSIAFSGGVLKATSGTCSEGQGALNKAASISADPYLWRTTESGAYTTGNITPTAHTGSYLELKTAPAPTVTVTPSGSVRFPQGAATGNAVFTVTSSDGTLNASANYASATLDGQQIDLGLVGTPGADGSVANGSLIATVNQAKLNTLTVGDHPLVITLQGAPFAGMTVRGVITVTALGGAGDVGPDVPETGDNAPVAFARRATAAKRGGACHTEETENAPIRIAR